MNKPIQNMGDDKVDMAKIILRRLYAEHKSGSSGADLDTLREATKAMKVGFNDVLDFLLDNKYIQFSRQTRLFGLTQLGINEVESEAR